MKLWVSELFHSIQGEGPYAGTPATFIRLGYCNLRCGWCDAWYTWDPVRVDLKKTLYRLDTDVVLKQIDETDNLVVVTGGEPLMQQEAIKELMSKSRYRLWQMETNGTIKPLNFPRTMSFVVSPKLANNGRDSLKRRMIPEVIKWFAGTAATFKFVIVGKDCITQVREFQLVYRIPPGRIYLMPEGTDSDLLNHRMPMLFEACKQYGYKYSDRLHIRAYGDKRGT